MSMHLHLVVSIRNTKIYDLHMHIENCFIQMLKSYEKIYILKIQLHCERFHKKFNETPFLKKNIM